MRGSRVKAIKQAALALMVGIPAKNRVKGVLKVRNPSTGQVRHHPDSAKGVYKMLKRAYRRA